MIAESISEQQVNSFRKYGVALLKGVFSDKWLDLLRGGAEQAMAAPSEVAREYAKDGNGRFFTDHHMHRRIEAFQKFTFESPAAGIAAQLLDSQRLNLFDEHLLVKEPGTDIPTYWHQDLPYYELAGTQICSLWVPLDQVTRESGAVRCVRGSHLWGKIYQPIRIGLGEPVEEADLLDGPPPDIDAAPDKYDIALYELEPGDCLAFHAAILHAAMPNRTNTVRRRAVSVRFAGDDVTWQPRPYIPSVPDAPDLIEGGPLDSDQYPVIWSS